ncbi:MAG: nucleoside hydrolase [Thermomicrobiales bacterium]
MTVAAKIPVILDVDTGIDDAMALALAVASPEVDLLAVTTLAGNVDVTRTTDNTLRVLEWLGGGDVPVHRGASHPLTRPHRDAAFVHGTNGLGNSQFPPASRSTAADRGPAAIVRLALQRPGEIMLVCVGPLTNLAIALNVEPSLPRLLKRLVIMGGAYGVPGNVTPHAEFNIFVDPEAAEQVFRAEWADATAIGLDVTHQTGLTADDWHRAKASSSAASTLFVKVAQRTFEERTERTFHLHDPLALGVAFDPSFVSTEVGDVSVDLTAERLGRTSLTPGSNGVRVATAVDAERFLAVAMARFGIGR